jgi:hypothetical protein
VENKISHRALTGIGIRISEKLAAGSIRDEISRSVSAI